MSLAQADAEKAITSAKLVVGDVTKEASDTVAAGSIVSQSPKAGASAREGDKVSLVVSTGKAEAKDVQVPDLKGKTQAEAEKDLANAKLVGVASNPEESTEVEPGRVFKQSIAAGTTVKEGEKVAFTTALAPTEVTVPDVVGKTQDDAKTTITNAKLTYDASSEYNNEVAEGTVISQSIAAGTKVKTGSTVGFVVSLGPEPIPEVTVPDVSGYTWKEAKESLESNGLNAQNTGYTKGVVVSQDVAAGTKVEQGTIVTVTLEDPNGGQDAIMNYVGVYGSGRATATVESAGNGKGKVTITWPSSASETTEWVMTGPFDSQSLTIDYTKGVKTNHVFDSKGNDKSTVEYKDGTGTITFKQNGKFTWEDDKEDAGNGMTFTFTS